MEQRHVRFHCVDAVDSADVGIVLTVAAPAQKEGQRTTVECSVFDLLKCSRDEMDERLVTHFWALRAIACSPTVMAHYINTATWIDHNAIGEWLATVMNYALRPFVSPRQAYLDVPYHAIRVVASLMQHMRGEMYIPLCESFVEAALKNEEGPHTADLRWQVEWCRVLFYGCVFQGRHNFALSAVVVQHLFAMWDRSCASVSMPPPAVPFLQLLTAFHILTFLPLANALRLLRVAKPTIAAIAAHNAVRHAKEQEEDASWRVRWSNRVKRHGLCDTLHIWWFGDAGFYDLTQSLLEKGASSPHYERLGGEANVERLMATTDDE